MLDETELRTLTKMIPVEARFWAKVRIIDDDASCWEWTGSRTKDGYGVFAWKDGPFPHRSVNAPRVAYYLINGEIPNVACHSCDNPPCVRPSHLWNGTNLDNIADRHAKGRSGHGYQAGEANGYAKLTDTKVIAIRARADDGETDQALAEDYGVARATITYIVRGKTWAHVGGPIVTGDRRVGKLTDADVQAIKDLLADGARGVDVASKFNVTPSLVSLIKHGKHR